LHTRFVDDKQSLRDFLANFTQRCQSMSSPAKSPERFVFSLAALRQRI